MTMRAKTRAEGDEAEQILKSLAVLNQKHIEIKILSESLTDRIVRFQDWVASLPGRTETSMWLSDPDGDEGYSLHVVLRKAGKKWEVAYGYSHQGDPDVDYHTLADAGVKIKAHVLPLLPTLIENMVESQEQLAEQIRAAFKTFDEFADRLKIPAKEGA